MSLSLRQMNSLLCWFIPTVMYFNMLFLDNSVADEPYYTESESVDLPNQGDFQFTNKTDEDKLVFKDIGFTIRVQQESYNSLIAYRNGTFFVTNSDNQFRSLRIVGGNVNSKDFSVATFTSSFSVRWADMPNCDSNSDATVDVRAYINYNGFIKCLISWYRRFYVPCFMTIEIIKGVLDKDGNIDKQELIYSKVFEIYGSNNVERLALNPILRCKEQKSQIRCISESQRYANCTWCEKCGECKNASSCNCSVDTKTTKSGMNEQPKNVPTTDHHSTQTNSATDFPLHKSESSNVYYIVVIVLGVVVIVLFIVGMIIWKFYFGNKLFSC
uniref:TonB box, N-terminal,domain-containing protein n=1 Tax=Schistosoma japonicum TaxID=6182 RepID=C1LJ17_SCHJA|nr:TonB box, N-terminal,domain-containing protein [Schistosoma japonicum]